MPSDRSPVIYVDVDDTLVRSFGSKRIPIGAMVARVRGGVGRARALIARPESGFMKTVNSDQRVRTTRRVPL